MPSYELKNITSNYESYEQLIKLYNQYKEDYFTTIDVSISKWLAANLTSALGGLLDKLISEVVFIKFSNINSETKTIIQKNNFLSHYGFSKLPDTYNTTIQYLKLKPTDGRFFNSYVFNQLLDRAELPDMTHALKRKIAESIYEIFVNAQMHSDTEFIYTCGQYYPKYHTIAFTITDTGKGFKNNIDERFKSNLSAEKAIQWATNLGYSTKTNVSGGLGLAILKEFIKLNKGKFQIVSDRGFYQFDKAGEQIKLFSDPFPGSIVNMEFRTDDSNSYCLSNESNSNNIF